MTVGLPVLGIGIALVALLIGFAVWYLAVSICANETRREDEDDARREARRTAQGEIACPGDATPPPRGEEARAHPDPERREREPAPDGERRHPVPLLFLPDHHFHDQEGADQDPGHAEERGRGGEEALRPRDHEHERRPEERAGRGRPPAVKDAPDGDERGRGEQEGGHRATRKP